MPKPWRLTRGAEAALTEIARWTYESFGPRQADAYRDDLIARCIEIADGSVPSQDCRRLISVDLAEDLRFTRAGQHFVIFVETPAQITIIDFLHARTDLPSRLAVLADPKLHD